MTAIFQSAILGTGAAALLLVFYAIGTAVYNIFFHPLRNFPGPKLAAASIIPYAINRIRGRQVRWTKSLHDTYGEVVRLAPDQLSFISAEAWKDIYGHRIAGKGGMSKDLRYYGGDLAGTNGILRADDEDHARFRRLLSHAFSDKALREQEPLVQQYVELLVEKLGDAARTPSSGGNAGAVDMMRMYNFTTFDVMADLTFGEALGLLEASDYSPWVRAFFGTVKLSTIMATINGHFPMLGAHVQRYIIPKHLIEQRRLHGAYAKERVDSRMARQTDRPDIWTFVLRNTESGKGMNSGEMHANGATLMGAGTETIATLLSGLTYSLLRNPDKLQKLTAEIRSTFTSRDDIDMLSLGKLTYLHACIEEGLRIYPPVPVGLPRIVPPEGRVICGKNVPGGTCTYVSQFAAYHSPTNFHEPEAFVPERWLPDPEPKFANDVLGVMEPFSTGPRNCIGKNLAYHEIRLILANVLWHYDLELCLETHNWMDQNVFFTWEKHPLMCKIKPVVRN